MRDVQNDFCAPGGMMGRRPWAGLVVVFVRNVYMTEVNRYPSDVWLSPLIEPRPALAHHAP